MELTNLHFNEDDLMWLLIAAETYMSEHHDCHKSIKDAQLKFNKIWYELKTDEEVYLAKKPE